LLAAWLVLDWLLFRFVLVAFESDEFATLAAEVFAVT
jgi:hypothetical protein